MVSGGSSEKIPAKRGPSQKLKGKGSHADVSTGLRGHSRENLGGGSCISQR